MYVLVIFFKIREIVPPSPVLQVNRNHQAVRVQEVAPVLVVLLLTVLPPAVTMIVLVPNAGMF